MQLSPIPSHGDLIPLDEFLDSVRNRFFMDYDGMGSWATATEYLDGAQNWVYPSNVACGADRPPTWATHVLWFNK